MKKHVHADLMLLFALDAQQTANPRDWWQVKDCGYWRDLIGSESMLHPNFEYRRKADAPPVAHPEPKVCEWKRFNNKGYTSCAGNCHLPEYRYCPDCGGRVVIQEKMCEMAGVEFPMPVKWKDRKQGDLICINHINRVIEIYDVDSQKNLYERNLAQRTQKGAEQQLKAMQAALRQAMEQAK